VALVGPPVVIAALAGGALAGGWPGAVRHVVFVLLLVLSLADFVVLTIDHVPFTRPYRPGHAKLKTRWPLYALGAYGFSSGLAALELAAWDQRAGSAVLLAGAADAALLAADAEAHEQRARQLLALAQQLGDELALLLEARPHALPNFVGSERHFLQCKN